MLLKSIRIYKSYNNIFIILFSLAAQGFIKVATSESADPFWMMMMMMMMMIIIIIIIIILLLLLLLLLLLKVKVKIMLLIIIPFKRRCSNT